MLKIRSIAGVMGLATVLMAASMAAQAPQPVAAPAAPRPLFVMATTSFEDGGMIPVKFAEPESGPGGTPSVPAPQYSPALAWSNGPENTASFVLVMEDADNIVNRSTLAGLHWMMFNIPATVHELPEGVPAQAQRSDGSIQVMNRKIAGYLGPGARAEGPYHHYTFSLYALDIKLSLGTDATEADVLGAMQGHVLRKAFVMGRFRRPAASVAR